MTDKTCPECGSDWSDGQTCTEHFHMMGFWELEYLLYDVHHLMVLSYHLQHPSLYSPETLKSSQQMLVQFLEGHVTPQAMRKQIGKSVDSGKRAHKIKGTPEAHGIYIKPIYWKMTASNVVHAGMDNYYVSVQKWAESILETLRESGNMP